MATSKRAADGREPAPKRTLLALDSLPTADEIVARCQAFEAAVDAARSPESKAQKAWKDAEVAPLREAIGRWITDKSELLVWSVAERLADAPDGWHVTFDNRFVVSTVVLTHAEWFAGTGVEPRMISGCLCQMLADHFVDPNIIIHVVLPTSDGCAVLVHLFIRTARRSYRRRVSARTLAE